MKTRRFLFGLHVFRSLILPIENRANVSVSTSSIHHYWTHNKSRRVYPVVLLSVPSTSQKEFFYSILILVQKCPWYTHTFTDIPWQYCGDCWESLKGSWLICCRVPVYRHRAKPCFLLLVCICLHTVPHTLTQGAARIQSSHFMSSWAT